ncbi:unnamed protein product, partial [Owenia fusiformis]
GLVGYESGEMIYASFNDALKQFRVNEQKGQVQFREILKKEAGSSKRKVDTIDSLVTRDLFPDKVENVQELGRKIYSPLLTYTGNDETLRTRMENAIEDSKARSGGIAPLWAAYNSIDKDKAIVLCDRKFPTRDAGKLLWVALKMDITLIQRGGKLVEPDASLVERMKALKSSAILSNISCHRRENITYSKCPSISGKTHIKPYLAWLASRTMNLSDDEKMNMTKSNDPAGLMKCISLLKGRQSNVGNKGKQKDALLSKLRSKMEAGQALSANKFQKQAWHCLISEDDTPKRENMMSALAHSYGVVKPMMKVSYQAPIAAQRMAVIDDWKMEVRCFVEHGQYLLTRAREIPLIHLFDASSEDLGVLEYLTNETFRTRGEIPNQKWANPTWDTLILPKKMAPPAKGPATESSAGQIVIINPVIGIKRKCSDRVDKASFVGVGINPDYQEVMEGLALLHQEVGLYEHMEMTTIYGIDGNELETTADLTEKTRGRHFFSKKDF